MADELRVRVKYHEIEIEASGSINLGDTKYSKEYTSDVIKIIQPCVDAITQIIKASREGLNNG